MKALAADDPRVIGEYRLRARLGAGGMGRVYLGYSPGGRAVAVKVVHPELARDAEFRHRFGREVAAARAVSGMYTAPVVAAGLDDDPPWLATAFVPGPPLADAGRRGTARCPSTPCGGWRAGWPRRCARCTPCGLVHRDLKPANVLLAADGPHVIDFGISRAFDGTAADRRRDGRRHARLHVARAGRGAPVGPASDVFSLGCVLAFAATGTRRSDAGSRGVGAVPGGAPGGRT